VGRETWDVERETWDVGRGTWDVGCSAFAPQSGATADKGEWGVGSGTWNGTSSRENAPQGTHSENVKRETWALHHKVGQRH